MDEFIAQIVAAVVIGGGALVFDAPAYVAWLAAWSAFYAEAIVNNGIKALKEKA